MKAKRKVQCRAVPHRPKRTSIVRAKVPQRQPWQMTNEQKELIKKQLCPGATDEELKFCFAVAAQYRLDPFRGQIWFIPRKKKVLDDEDQETKERVWVPLVGINGLRHIAARDHVNEYGSEDEPEFGEIKSFPMSQYENEKRTIKAPEWARVAIWKRGCERPTVATVWWCEIYPDITSSPLVRRMPRQMLGKCASAAAIRKAYPATDGLYIREEFQDRPEFTPEGRAILYPREQDTETVCSLRRRGLWCDEHQTTRSTQHLREFHFDETYGPSDKGFAARLQPASTEAGNAAPQSAPEREKLSAASSSASVAQPGAVKANLPSSAPGNQPGGAATTSPDARQVAAPSKTPVKAALEPARASEKPKMGDTTSQAPKNAPAASRGSSLNFKTLPMTRVPIKVAWAKETKNKKGIQVHMEIGVDLFCFDNRKMGEDGERLFDLLLASAGKDCIFVLTRQKTKVSGREFTHIAALLRMGEREWESDGTPVLRREAPHMREPGEED